MKKNDLKKFFLGTAVSLCVVGACGLVSNLAIKNNWFEKEDTRPYINGLNVTIFGDSISTFDGYSNDSTRNSTLSRNIPRYGLPSSTLGSIDTHLSSVDKTYWMKTINDLDMNYLINNTWRSTRVTTTYTTYSNSAGCQDRCINLHNEFTGVEPDIIVIFFGINDFDHEVELGDFTSINDIYDFSTKEYIADTTIFSQAYAKMLHRIQDRYKKSDIYLMNLLPNHYERYDELAIWNKQIAKIGNYFDCNIVDIHGKSGIATENFRQYQHDGLHPNETGMEMISNVLKESLLKNYRLKK